MMGLIRTKVKSDGSNNVFRMSTYFSNIYLKKFVNILIVLDSISKNLFWFFYIEHV